MTAIYIICGIFLFFFILLLIPAGAEISYFDKFKITLRYAGIKVYDSDKKEKPPQQANISHYDHESKPHKGKSKKQNFISKIFAQKGKIEGIKFCFRLIKVALSKIIWVIRKIKFRELFLDITVSSDDAANTAVTYGAVCATVYPVINLIDCNTSLGVKKVNIHTNFDKTSPEIKASVRANTRLIYAVIAAVSLLLPYLRIKKESDKNG